MNAHLLGVWPTVASSGLRPSFFRLQRGAKKASEWSLGTRLGQQRVHIATYIYYGSHVHVYVTTPSIVEMSAHLLCVLPRTHMVVLYILYHIATVVGCSCLNYYYSKWYN